MLNTTPHWQALTHRVRFISAALLIVFLGGWSLWLLPFDDLLDRSGTPLGADFSMFYVAGSIVADGDIELLYDQAEHQRRLQSLFPRLDPRFCLPYRYPPIVAILAAPLATLPYAAAFAVFFLASVSSWWAAVALLARELTVLRSPSRNWLLWAIAGWPVALETIVGGQASMFAVLICVGTIVALRRGRDTLAGALLALALFKPNVLLLFAIGAVAYRPSLLRGAIPLVAVTAGVVGWYVGWPIMTEYATLTSDLATTTWQVETPFWKVHSLASWLAFVIPQHHRLVSAAAGGLAALAVGWQWRRKPESWTIYVVLLLSINALCNPYTPIYDLSLLLIAGLCAAEYFLADARGELVERSGWSAAGVMPVYVVLSTLYFAPHFSQAIAGSTGLQLFPLLLLVATCWLCANTWRSEWARRGSLGADTA